MQRRPILVTAAAVIWVTLSSQTALADDRLYMRCEFSGESIRDPSVKGAILDESERLWFDDVGSGIWSDDMGFEIEPKSSRVLMRWNGRMISARRLVRFRPYRIVAEISEPDAARKWWFRFRGLNFSSRFFGVIEGAVDASKTSAGMSHASVGFHGHGSCYALKKCDARNSRCGLP
jgi:hypothetical protein